MSDGREEGVKEFVFSKWGFEGNGEKWDIKLVPVDYTDYGMPYIDSMFKKASEVANNDVLCFINSDIIPISGLMEAVSHMKKSGLKEFILTGQRYDVDVDDDLDWEYIGVHRNIFYYLQKSTFHDSGGDYFMFPKSMDWSHMPPFAAARGKWDTWINGDALERGIPLIRATDSITLLHQNHSSDFLNIDSASPEYKQQLEHNKELAGKTYLMFGDRLWQGNKDFGCDMATHVLQLKLEQVRPHPVRVKK